MSEESQNAGKATEIDVANALATIRASRELALAAFIAKHKILKTKKP